MRFYSVQVFLLKVRRREEKGPLVVQGDIEEFLWWIIWADNILRSPQKQW